MLDSNSFLVIISKYKQFYEKTKFFTWFFVST